MKYVCGSSVRRWGKDQAIERLIEVLSGSVQPTPNHLSCISLTQTKLKTLSYSRARCNSLIAAKMSLCRPRLLSAAARPTCGCAHNRPGNDRFDYAIPHTRINYVLRRTPPALISRQRYGARLFTARIYIYGPTESGNEFPKNF